MDGLSGYKEMNEFSVRMVGWHEGESLLRAVREEVFIREQLVPAELEWDGLDENCSHVLALNVHGNAIGCGRLTQKGYIGRMAVLKEWRRKKVGSVLLETLMIEARNRVITEVVLSAQVQALPFYLSFGFVEEGEVFMDAGILHRMMRLRF